jgi:putative ABC transport system permease protein
MSWFRFWRRRKLEESDLEEELRAHLAIEARRRAESGDDPVDAAFAARRAFGSLARIQEETRDAWGWSHLQRFFDDVRHGLRMLRKTPGWTAVISGTLTLGIGLTTAIFSLVYSVLLQPLPYREPDRLMALWITTTAPEVARGVSKLFVSAANWNEWRLESKSFEDIALARPIANFNLTGDGPPERLQGGRTSWNLPHLLGVQPLIGRVFTEEENHHDARVAILSYAFWTGRFGRDPNIIGRKIQLNGEPFQVIGVMPPDYAYPSKDFDLWTPLFIPPGEIQARDINFQYISVGRLKSGVSREQAQAEMSAIMSRTRGQYPLDALVEPLLASTVGDVSTALYVLLGAVGCLLLISCINLGVLLIARATARSREMAVRSALGASSSRLARQMLAEILPLSAFGVTSGLLAAWGLLKLALPWLPPTMPRTEAIGLHYPVFVFAGALSLMVVVLAGMLPARLAARIPLSAAWQQDSRTASAASHLRGVLVAVQIAITLTVLFGGGLLVRSLAAVLSVRPGFTADRVLTMHLAVTRVKYPKDSQVADYYRRIVERVKSIPGVLEAGFVNRLPFSGIAQTNSIEFEGKPELGALSVDSRSATPGYFAAIGIPLIRGRIFSDQDKTPTGLIDEQLAKRVFGKESPLGKRFRFSLQGFDVSWVEIVGVVGHIRNDGLESDPRPQAYWPETVRAQDRAALVVRTAGQPESFTTAVVERIHNENPEQPVYDVRSMEAWIDRSLQSRNLLTGLVTFFGAASLFLACLGLYGVVSYTAGLRLREFGIRIALGARPRDIRTMVILQAGKLALWGSAAGMIAAWPVSRALQTFLFGVRSTDTVTWLAVPIFLVVVCLLASFGPAGRSGRIDPSNSLRCD